MNILRAIVITLTGIILLLIFWPLFIILLITIALYWVYFRTKIVTMRNEAGTQQAPPPSSSGSPKDVIEAEYTERSE